MNINQFAVSHHARVRKDECGEPIIIRLAMKITGARIRRQLSPEKRDALVARLQTARAKVAA